MIACTQFLLSHRVAMDGELEPFDRRRFEKSSGPKLERRRLQTVTLRVMVSNLIPFDRGPAGRPDRGSGQATRRGERRRTRRTRRRVGPFPGPTRGGVEHGPDPTPGELPTRRQGEDRWCFRAPSKLGRVRPAGRSGYYTHKRTTMIVARTVCIHAQFMQAPIDDSICLMNCARSCVKKQHH